MLLQIVLVLVGIVILMILQVPIGFAFGAGGLLLMFIFDVDPLWAVPTAFKLLMSFSFLALPLYLLLGSIAGVSGIAGKICDLVVSLIGRLKGSLGIAVIVTNGIFGAISGAAMSALAGIGKAFLLPMEKEGYPRGHIAALLVASAVLALLIPPSGTMIIFGFMARLPISLCFLAPIIPGLILIALLSATHLWMCRHIPTIHVMPTVSFRTYIRGAMKKGSSASFGLLLPVLVLGGIYGGLYTPSEAAGIGVFYAAIVGLFIYRALTLRQLAKNLLETGIIIGSIVALFFFFIIIGKIFIIENVSDSILTWMMAISTNRLVLLGMLNILMLLMGMIIDDASAMMISAIILLPIATSIGVDPYHFAAIAAVNLGLGLITPPVAPLLYLAEAITGVQLHVYIKPVFYYIIFAYMPTLIITIIFPPLSTVLPHLFA
jgi:C4-dicarboxylate transporter DctM subunit